MKFAPAVAELLPFLKKHIEQWRNRGWAAARVKYVYDDTIKAVLKREAEEQVANVRRAAAQTMIARRTLSQQVEETKAKLAKLAQEVEETKAKLAKLIKDHAAAEARERAAAATLRELTEATTEAPAVTP